MDSKLKKRSEVCAADTWKLEDMYPNNEAWKEDVDFVSNLLIKLGALQGKLGADADTLYTALRAYSDSVEHLLKIFNYAQRAYDVDTKNTENQGLSMQAMDVYTKFCEQTAFLNPELLEIPEETIEAYMKEKKELEEFRNFIKDTFRMKAHVLSKEMESMLASATDILGGPEQIFSMFDNADLVFPEITDDEGKKVQVTHGRYRSLLEKGSERVRRETFEVYYKMYETYKNTLASVYQSEVKGHIFVAKSRKYDSCLESAVDANDVPTAVYKNLVETVNKNMDKMHRYIALRKKLLGVSEQHMYDLFVPLVKGVDKKVPYTEAKQMVYDALEPMGERYRSILKEAFDNRWIDVYENEGKRSGAYSAGVYGVHPYVLLNYDETLDSAFTLAHELGHALHSYLSNTTQSNLDSDYKIFVAEVASTCNESLLTQYLLSRTTDKKERAYIINHLLDDFRTTLYRQTMFAEFELLTHEMAERGESLTAEAISEVYYNLNKKYYGDAVVHDEQIAMEWARIPHFYMNFYVYQYATGFSAALALSNKILKEGAPAVENYIKFLSGGCSKSPIELLKIAGVDMTTPKPVEEALQIFDNMLDEMEALL